MILNYAKSAKEAEETAAAVRAAGAEAVTVQGDVAEDADCLKIAAAAQRFGRIDALVNNAGITKHVRATPSSTACRRTTSCASTRSTRSARSR